MFVCESRVKGMYLAIFAIELYDTLSSYELCSCPLILRHHSKFSLLEILTIFWYCHVVLIYMLERGRE